MRSLIALAVLALAAGTIGGAMGSEELPWGYDIHDPAERTLPVDWYTLAGNEACAGDRQSPIDIVTADVVTSTLGVLSHTWDVHANATIVNNGHSVDVLYDHSDPANRAYTWGGAAGDDKYYIAMVHWHWGSVAEQGSEHTFDGRASSLEMHVVHFNDKYPASEVFDHSDGLLVVGFMFDEAESGTDENIEAMFALFNEKVSEGGAVVDAQNLHLNDLLVLESTEYYNYLGSLTTPACAEIVTWVVMKEILPISNAALTNLRELSETMSSTAEQRRTRRGSHEHEELLFISDNFRPVQALNGREVRLGGVQSEQEKWEAAMADWSGAFAEWQAHQAAECQ